MKQTQLGQHTQPATRLGHESCVRLKRPALSHGRLKKLACFGSSPPRGYYMDSLLEYYHANNISFPKQLTEDQSLRKLFARDIKFMDPNRVEITAWISDEELIRAIVKGQEIGSFVQYRIDQLERQLSKYTYEKRIYGYIDNRGSYDEQTFAPILDYIRTKLSKSDYYIFLAALIRSRELGHTVFITNDGDLDLKNVIVTFPAPLSKVTDTRANNILDCSAHTSLLHEVVESTSDITLHLPSFKKGESLSLNIRTRENEINTNEVFKSYEGDNLIDKARALLWFCFILIISLIPGIAGCAIKKWEKGSGANARDN